MTSALESALDIGSLIGGPSRRDPGRRPSYDEHRHFLHRVPPPKESNGYCRLWRKENQFLNSPRHPTMCQPMLDPQGTRMQVDPRAIQIRTDGSCYRDRRLISGCAAIVEYPEHLQRDREQIVDFGCAESSINRMELLAVIRSLKWVRDKSPWKGVTRVQIISDSKYVVDNISRVHEWRKNKWRNRHDQPLENSDLWKQFLSVSSRTKITVHFGWTPGKQSPALKEIDKAAKTAALRGGPDKDRGYSLEPFRGQW
jgi:ribonuclease HI